MLSSLTTAHMHRVTENTSVQCTLCQMRECLLDLLLNWGLPAWKPKLGRQVSIQKESLLYPEDQWLEKKGGFVSKMPTVQETQVRSLGQEGPLEKEMVTHSSILAWRIPWMEEPGRLQSSGSQRVRHDWETSLVSKNQLWWSCSTMKGFIGKIIWGGAQNLHCLPLCADFPLMG